MIMLLLLILFIIIILIVTLIPFNYINNNNNYKKINDDSNNYCNNEKLLTYIQKDQFRLAKYEILSSGDDQTEWNNFTRIISKDKYDDFVFYTINYGIVVFDLEELTNTNNHKNKKQLVYYRIYKNGNDNIRAHLYRVATLIGGGPFLNKGFEHACCNINYDEKNLDPISCSLDKCRHQYLQMIPAGRVLNQIIPSKLLNMRYAFTFIRHPLSRFISGYSEIEYRLSIKKNLIHYLPLFSKVGTIERFKEFIRMLINYEGSKTLFRNRNTELEHIAPQIGVLFAASKTENKKLNLYRLENFNEEWKRLSKDSGINQLLDSYEEDQLASHQSSTDPNGTKSAAYRFLNPVLNNNTKKYYNNDDDDNNNIKSDELLNTVSNNISHHYLRAICRIYLPDFKCLNYELPLACQSILDDVQNSIDKYNEYQLNLEMKIGYRKYLKIFLSEYVLEVMAVSSCYISSSLSLLLSSLSLSSSSSSSECFYKTLAWLKGIDYVNDDDDDDDYNINNNNINNK